MAIQNRHARIYKIKWPKKSIYIQKFPYLHSKTKSRTPHSNLFFRTHTHSTMVSHFRSKILGKIKIGYNDNY